LLHLAHRQETALLTAFREFGYNFLNDLFHYWGSNSRLRRSNAINWRSSFEWVSEPGASDSI
jgi:hypothetical protein